MKLHTNHTNIERGGVQAESSFTIKTNALSFSILSSGLYTDPEMAIVRELSCNAYDAHIAAKNSNTPFEIHLPNELEPFLSIKDYGIGLSDEDIQGEMVPVMVEDPTGELITATNEDGTLQFNRTGGLYTTYFDSTKTNSNDFIGALGLGSKSPFSYSDAFEVISRYNGKKRTYAIFLNEDGIPTIAKMGDIDTDEHSGLEVKITIKPNDFYKFKNKTATALMYFPVKPKITGALNFEFDQLPKYKIETDEWMLSSAGRYSSSSLIAVQGNVAYRVNSEQIKDKVDDDLYAFINRSHIVMFYNIGELEVSANREEIRYDAKSVEAIANKLKKLNKEFTSEVVKKFGDINKKYWFACIELNKLSNELFNREDAIRSFLKADEVHNKNLKRYIEDNGRVGYKQILGHDLNRYRINGYYTKSSKLKRSDVSSTVDPNDTTLIVINDVKRGGLARLKEYLMESHYNDAIVITQRLVPLERLDNNCNPVKFEGYDLEFSRLIEELGSPDVHKISEITEEPIRESISRSLSFYRYGGTYSGSGSHYYHDKIAWNSIIGNIDDGGLYIPLKYASSPSFINSDGKLEPLHLGVEMFAPTIHFILSAYNDINDTDYTVSAIMALPTITYNKVKKLDDWVDIFSFVKEILPNYIEELTFHKQVSKTSGILGIKKHIMEDGFVENIKKLDSDSVFKQQVLPLIEGNEKYSAEVMSQIKVIETLYNRLLDTVDIDQPSFYDDTAFTKYPMLTLVSELAYNGDWSVLFDYIKLIDRSKK